MIQLTHHEIIEHKACKIVGRAIRTKALTKAKLLDLGLEADYSSIFGIEIYTMERFVAEQEKGKGNAILDYLIPLK